MVHHRRLTVTEAKRFETFDERVGYLFLGDNNVTSPRDISNSFYQSKIWKRTRLDIIDRDDASDLGLITEPISGIIIVHHINPLVDEDFLNYDEDRLLNPEYLITTQTSTHNLIHYRKTLVEYAERKPGDTILWQQ